MAVVYCRCITAWPVRHYNHALTSSVEKVVTKIKSLETGTTLTYHSNSPLRPWSRPAVPQLVVGDYRSRMMWILRKLNRIGEDRQISHLSRQ
jgi:hypothetical protein